MSKQADITISRAYYSDCTLGRLFTPHGGHIHTYTLELPWMGNERSISAIPEGLYTYHFGHSNRAKREVIWINNVPERSLIQIHPGNFTRHIEGCILPGNAIQDINGDGIPDVVNSGRTLDVLMAVVPSQGTIIFTSARQPAGVYQEG